MSAHSTTLVVGPTKLLPKIYKFPGLVNTPLALRIAYDDPLPFGHVYSVPYRNKEEWPRKTNHCYHSSGNLLLVRAIGTAWVGRDCKTVFSEFVSLFEGTSHTPCDSYIANALVGHINMEQDTRRRFYIPNTLTRPSGLGGEVMVWQFNGTRRPIVAYIPMTTKLVPDDCILIVPTQALKEIQPIMHAESTTQPALQ